MRKIDIVKFLEKEKDHYYFLSRDWYLNSVDKMIAEEKYELIKNILEIIKKHE